MLEHWQKELLPCDQWLCVVVPLILLLKSSDLFELFSLATDLSFLPIYDLSVFRQLIFPAWAFILQTFQLKNETALLNRWCSDDVIYMDAEALIYATNLGAESVELIHALFVTLLQVLQLFGLHSVHLPYTRDSPLNMWPILYFKPARVLLILRRKRKLRTCLHCQYRLGLHF